MAIAAGIRGRTRKRLGNALLAAAALLVLIPSAARAVEAPAIRVTSAAAVETPSSGRPKVTTTMTVDLPAGHRLATALRGDDADAESYWIARRWILSGYGLFPFRTLDDTTSAVQRLPIAPDRPNEVHSFFLLNDLADPPEPRPSVAKDRATTTVSATTELRACCDWPGHWRVIRTDQGIRLSIAAARVPDDVSWTVRLDAGTHELGGLDPRPRSTEENQRATWVFGPTEKSVEVRAEVQLTDRERLTLSDETGRAAIAQPLGWGLGQAAFLLLLVFVLRSPLPAPLRGQRRLAAGCALACALIAAAWAGSIVIAEESPQPFHTGAFDRLMVAVSIRTALPLACFAIGAIVLARWRLRSSRWTIIALVLWLVLAVVVAVALAFRQFTDYDETYPLKPPWTLDETVASILAVGLIVSTAAFTWLFLTLALRGVWPWRSPDRVPRSVIGALVLLLVLSVGQWVWWARVLADSTADQFRAGIGDVPPDDFATALQWHALLYPVDLGTIADDVLVVIGYGAAVRWLRLDAQRTATSVFLPDSRCRLLLAGMLAAALGAAGDVLLGVPVPLGIIVVFGGVLALLRLNAPRVSALQAAAALLDEGSRARLLRDRALSERVHESRRAAVLGLGPAPTWWENGVVAVRYGALIGLAPGILYVVLSLNRFHWADLGPHASLGLPWVLTVVIAEITFWLVVSFAFGCLYAHLPGWNGAIKGFCLGAVAGVLGIAYLVLPLDRDVVSPGYGILEMLLFFVLLGIVLDWRTLRERDVEWHRLLDHYAASRVQLVLGYAVPILVSAAILLQQIIAGDHAQALSGDAQARLTEAIRGLPARGP